MELWTGALSCWKCYWPYMKSTGLFRRNLLLNSLKTSNSNPNPNSLANQLWCIDFLTPPTPLIISHRLPAFLESLMPLKNWCSTITLVLSSRRTVKDSARTQMSSRETKQSAGTDFSQNSSPYIVSKFPRHPHGHTSSPTLYLFFNGYSLHLRNACFPLVTTYTYKLLVYRLSLFDFICNRMNQSTISAGFISGQSNILQYLNTNTTGTPTILLEVNGQIYPS